jgi:predicted DNA-binding transcriptional regulator AlpA
MEEPLIDIDELARRLKVAPKTIRNHLSEGTWPIPPVRIGGALRWRPADVSRRLSELYEKYSRRARLKRRIPPARKLKRARFNRSTGKSG